MAQPSELMGLGIASPAARALGQTQTLAVSAAGTTQATATAVSDGFVDVTTAASNAGVILPVAAGAAITSVRNGDSNTMKVYPAVGDLMNGTANAAFSITTGKVAIFIPSGNRWHANLSA